MSYKSRIFLAGFALSLSALLGTGVMASDNAAAFLQVGLGAAPSGTGQAYVAEARDAQAVYWNAAGLAGLKTGSATLFSTHLIETDYLSAQFAMPTGFGNWGVGYTSAKLGDAIETNRSNGRAAETGNLLSYAASAYYVGTGVQILPGLSIGVSGKYIQETIATHNGSGLGLDAGVLFEATPDLAFGINAQNIVAPHITWDTPSSNMDSVPFNLKLGMRWRVLEKKLSILVDTDIQNNRPSLLHTGLAYQLAEPLILRAGYNQSTLSLGTGLVLSPFMIDFSWEAPVESDLDSVYKVSVGVEL